MTRSHHEPRGQSLDIPFPAAECDFIEFVQAKYELAFRRRESAKRHQMRVAAYGHDQAGIRYLAQVVRLQDRAAPEERKRRLHHPSISERDQSFNASPAVLLQQFDRVAVYRSDLGVRGTSHLLAVRLACGHTRRRLVFSRHPTSLMSCHRRATDTQRGARSVWLRQESPAGRPLASMSFHRRLPEVSEAL